MRIGDGDRMHSTPDPAYPPWGYLPHRAEPPLLVLRPAALPAGRSQLLLIVFVFFLAVFFPGAFP
jgi:hypothetical protein